VPWELLHWSCNGYCIWLRISKFNALICLFFIIKIKVRWHIVEDQVFHEKTKHCPFDGQDRIEAGYDIKLDRDRI